MPGEVQEEEWDEEDVVEEEAPKVGLRQVADKRSAV